MEKDPQIIDLLNWLHERLGDQFAITDHWEGDLRAIGISASEDPTQLVYILSHECPTGSYALQLESAPRPGSKMAYQDAGKFDSVSREELLAIVTQHLRIAE